MAPPRRVYPRDRADFFLLLALLLFCPEKRKEKAQQWFASEYQLAEHMERPKVRTRMIGPERGHLSPKSKPTTVWIRERSIMCTNQYHHGCLYLYTYK